MSERLLSVDEEPHRPGSRYRALRVNGVWACHMLHDRAGLARAELDRLYAAAEANQAPGPDWKAKLREQVERHNNPSHSGGWIGAIATVLQYIDALPDPPTPDPDAPPVGVELIAAERRRQVEAEGWTPEHDDQHTNRELARAATHYCASAAEYGRPGPWPWDPKWWKPTGDSIRDLTKAGALIAAEIDRLIRAETAAPDTQAPTDAGSATADGHEDGASAAGASSGSAPATDDAPPVYVPPEGHVAPVEGRNVPDGWEGQLLNSRTDSWWTAYQCSENPTTLFEVRRVPAPEPATEWVPLTKLVGRTIKGETKPVGRFLTAINDGCRWTSDGTRWHYFPDGTLNLDTAQVLVLAERERS